jgi:hypothetical protein
MEIALGGGFCGSWWMLELCFLLVGKRGRAGFSELEFWWRWRAVGRVKRIGIFVIFEFERDEVRKRYFGKEVGFVKQARSTS